MKNEYSSNRFIGEHRQTIAKELVQKGHSVIVIFSKAERKKDIKALGAKAAIGTMEDANFLTETFKGADIVYGMETLDAAGGFFNKNLDYIATINKIGNNYKEAIHRSGVKRVVHLSSIGAHMDKRTGILVFHHNAENILKQLPNDVSIKFMRPLVFITICSALYEL